jgi:4-nitrophenyl phosphatase
VRAASPAGARVLVVGEAGLREALVDQGLEPADDEAAVDWVVAGLDRAFDYQKLSAATHAILAGARFLATNTDALLPMEGGDVLPGAGSIVAAISAATGAKPVVAGKPEPALFRRGLQRLGNLAPAEVAMIGDRLDTDVEGGRRAGLRTVLVLTGVTDAGQVESAPHPPDAVVPGLAAVAPLLGWEQGDSVS